MSLSVRRYAGTPDLLGLAHARPERYPGLLESVAEGGTAARWDILFAFPEDSIVQPFGASGERFLDRLDAAWRGALAPGLVERELPFRGGWLVLLGYARAAEGGPRLEVPAAPAGLPSALALRRPAASPHAR